MYIPPELLTLILATFPVKALVQFRSVCKYWCSIIDHPDFVFTHFKLCDINSEEHNVLAIEKLGRRGGEGCMLTIRDANTLQKTAHILSNPKYYGTLMSCRGLLLLRSSRDNSLRLWNPSIRKSVRIPPCPLNHGKNSRGSNYVFGFDPQSKDYKVIAITSETSPNMELPKVYCAVYTLGDQQWSVRNNGLNLGYWYFDREVRGYSFWKTGFYAQGAAHWFARDPCHGDYPNSLPSTHLVSLHFDTEKFTFLELPFVSEESNVRWFMFLLKESLAIFSISAVRSTNIWLLKQDTEIGTWMWTPWFSRSSSGAGFAVLGPIGPLMFYYESDDGGCFLGQKTSYYNIVSRKVPPDVGKYMSYYPHLEKYVESLVLCKGYETEDLMCRVCRELGVVQRI